jgi:hypothetical protein
MPARDHEVREQHPADRTLAGWNTQLLARRVTQLGDLACTAPWDKRLRDLWREMFDVRAREFPNDPTPAFDLSAQLLANQFFLELVGLDD